MKKRVTIFTIFITVMVLAACGKETKTDTDTSVLVAETEVYKSALPGEYDSADTAILVAVNDTKGTLSFYNYQLEKSYTLNYDAITKFYDKYGTAISVNQLKEGSIADIKFLKSSKTLTDFSLNKDAFSVSEVTGFSIDTGAKVFSYKEDSYKITGGTILLSENGTISLKDLDAIDEVTITGMDTTIYGVTVNKGHGYLTLSNEEELIDGILEINGVSLERIKTGLRVPVLTGETHIKITKDDTNAERTVTIEPYKETVLDLGDVEIAKEKIGKVIFALEPKDATVMIDGQIVDASKMIELEYGAHKISATCDGYRSFSKMFNVGEENAVLDVILESTGEEKEEKEEENGLEGYYVFITGPESVEITIDGNYIGMSPLSVPKKPGSHIISLRKNGYKSRSYTVEIDNTEKDVYYGFEELEREKENGE